MAEFLGDLEGHSNSATRERSVVNGVTVTDGDFVYQSGDRFTNAAIAGKRLSGTVTGGNSGDLLRTTNNSATTGDSDGNAKVLVNIQRDARYLIKVGGTGANTLAAADEGSYFNLVQGTGAAQTVDYATKSATVGQLKLLKVNPGIRGLTAPCGIFVIAFSDRAASASA